MDSCVGTFNLWQANSLSIASCMNCAFCGHGCCGATLKHYQNMFAPHRISSTIRALKNKGCFMHFWYALKQLLNHFAVALFAAALTAAHTNRSLPLYDISLTFAFGSLFSFGLLHGVNTTRGVLPTARRLWWHRTFCLNFDVLSSSVAVHR